jgi:8-oxo-dGTP pyrophosphatase MutT (NUDIX family)
LVSDFAAAPEEEKSRELILALLEQTKTPFSRYQFNSGHITCTALVLHPERTAVLLAYHHRHRRWLLPGGHVEETDVTLEATAAREAVEETEVRIVPASIARFVGMDVHGIPARKNKREPFHLHHDLIFAMEAESDVLSTTEEAPEVAWCGFDEFDHYDVPASIVRAASRAR